VHARVHIQLGSSTSFSQAAMTANSERRDGCLGRAKRKVWNGTACTGEVKSTRDRLICILLRVFTRSVESSNTALEHIQQESSSQTPSLEKMLVLS
jgi:hypothetical protein